MMGELLPMSSVVAIALGLTMASGTFAMKLAIGLVRQHRYAAHIRRRLTEVTVEAPHLTVVETSEGGRSRAAPSARRGGGVVSEPRAA